MVNCQEKTEFSMFNMLIFLAIIGLSSAQVLSDKVSDQADIPVNNSSTRSVINILKLEEFLELAGKTGTAGYVVLFCGKDREKENKCGEILDTFKQFHLFFPEFEEELIYYDLNEGDWSIMNYFEIESIPHLMYIRERRVYTYKHTHFALKHLASFIDFFHKNSDVLWRHFPTSEKTKVGYYLEGLYRIQDKLYMMFGGVPFAMPIVNFLIGCLGLFFVGGVVMFFYYAITGKAYQDMEAQLDAGKVHKPTTLEEADSQGAKKSVNQSRKHKRE